MLQTQNKIILVDNNPEHLKDLSEGFFNDNISCLPITYDVAYDSPLKGIRLAFFDINLLNGSDESQILSTIVDALPKYIDKNNGPFALIFWTDKKEYVPKIKAYIKERNLEIPKPFLVDCIDKDECYNQPDKLRERLEEIFVDPTLNVIIEYENVVNNSVNKTTNQFFETIPATDDWGFNENYVQNFDRIFSKIASATLGIKHAKEQPDKAVHLALTENLNYHIENSEKKGTWKEVLNALSTANNEREIELIEDYNYSSLNNLLHINLNTHNLTKIDRGVVINLKHNILLDYSLSFAQFYDSTIPLNKSVVQKTVRKCYRNKSKLICIEISASCDHSQKKSRINKYIMGIITPSITKDMLDEKRLTASSLNVIEYEGEEENMQLWINLNFMLGWDSNNPNFQNILFGLKKEIVNFIGNRYANHVSRIGITSF